MIDRSKEQELVDLLGEFSSLASKEAKEHIDHYCWADEYEIAFELLILDLISQGIKPGCDLKKWRQLLLDFNIDKTTQDGFIMEKFDKWAATPTSNS